MALKNVVLQKGRCPICKGLVEESWAGKNPCLGTICERCNKKYHTFTVFKPENVKFAVKKQIVFDPLLGVYRYHFDWKGTKLKVNGKVGRITHPQGDGDFVDFGDKKDNFGTFIKGVGYGDLLEMYKETGGDVTPPPLNLPECLPEKAELLNEPILPIGMDMRERVIYSVFVGSPYGLMESVPYLEGFHAFANLYCRYKFGLAPNYCFEGGFIGKDFEVRNLQGGVGLSIRYDRLNYDLRSATTPDEFEYIANIHQFQNWAYQNEQSRLERGEKNADVYTVINTWIKVMGTLLRYNWREESEESIGSIWRCYCQMQNLLLNFMDKEELEAALAYCRNKKMNHCGKSY